MHERPPDLGAAATIAVRGRRVARAAVLLASAALTVAGCGAPSTATPEAASTPGAQTVPAGAGPVAAGPGWGHVHNLTLAGERLLLGTHEGLWEQSPGRPARLLSDPPFDVMGFALTGARMLASGHPGEGQDLPADLGLRESTDGGATWRGVALEGQVDFHRLRGAGDLLLGLSAHDGRLLRSRDAGRTWADLGTPPLFDLALDPGAPDHVVATTQQGLLASDDGGTTFTPVAGAPLLALLAWAPTVVTGVAPDGVVHTSTDAGTTWHEAGRVPGQPTALAADATRLVVLVGDTVLESTDGGTSYAPRITGIAG